MAAYYNEHDPQKAEWLRVLIEWGEIAPGVVDARDMQEVRAADLRGFTQAHFCAGVALWSLALRRADWPDDRPAWSASLPCQPFSTAGKGRGTDDARHLWPCFFDLFRECRPVVCFGEQVINGDPARAWFDRVAADLESQGYAVGACGLPAAGFGAPHQRHRLYFVAHPKRGAAKRHGYELAGEAEGVLGTSREQRIRPDARDGIADGELAHPSRFGRNLGGGRSAGFNWPPYQSADGWPGEGSDVGDAFGAGLEGHAGDDDDGHEPRRHGEGPERPTAEAGEPGAWDRVEWVLCRDPQRGLVWRPIEPEFGEVASGSAGHLVCGSDRSTFPMVRGAKARTLRIKGYGDGICVPVAGAFIRAYCGELV